jgi:hypothetical protein
VFRVVLRLYSSLKLLVQLRHLRHEKMAKKHKSKEAGKDRKSKQAEH